MRRAVFVVFTAFLAFASAYAQDDSWLDEPADPTYQGPSFQSDPMRIIAAERAPSIFYGPVRVGSVLALQEMRYGATGVFAVDVVLRRSNQAVVAPAGTPGFALHNPLFVNDRLTGAVINQVDRFYWCAVVPEARELLRGRSGFCVQTQDVPNDEGLYRSFQERWPHANLGDETDSPAYPGFVQPGPGLAGPIFVRREPVTYDVQLTMTTELSNASNHYFMLTHYGSDGSQRSLIGQTVYPRNGAQTVIVQLHGEAVILGVGPDGGLHLAPHPLNSPPD